MAETRREYQTIFTIGGKLLGSFHGAMGAAQVRLRRLQAVAVSAFRKIGAAVLGLGTLAAGFAMARFLKSIFTGVQNEATEAHQRVRVLTSAFMRLRKIQASKDPLKTAQGQVKIMQSYARSVADTSVLHEDLYENMAVQLAQFGSMYPAQIKEMLPSLGELLVELKGVTATEEDATEMAHAFALAIKGGNLRAVRSYGILDKEETKVFGKLQSRYDRYQYLMERLKTHQGSIARAMKEPEGRIQMLQNALHRMRDEIDEELLPIQAEMADAWRKALPEMKPVIISSIRALGRAAKWAATEMKDLTTALTTPETAKAWADVTNAWKNLVAVFNVDIDTNKSLGTMLGEFITNQLELMAKELKQILELIKSVKDAWNNLGIKPTKDYHPWQTPMPPKPPPTTMQDLAREQRKQIAAKPAGAAAAATNLAAYAGVFEEAEKTNKLPSGLLTAIAKAENVKPEYRNPLGLSTDAGVKKFRTEAESLEAIRRQAALMTNPVGPYKDYVRTKRIEDLGKVYSKPGARNDIYGTNATWPATVKSFMAAQAAKPPPAARPLMPTPPTFIAGMPEGLQMGGLVQRPGIFRLAERGAEAVIPLHKLTRPTELNFSPTITINGNATEADQRAMDSKLRLLARDFVRQFTAAQYHERRLSYMSGYG